jgi:hypothetical protein
VGGTERGAQALYDECERTEAYVLVAVVVFELIDDDCDRVIRCELLARELA